MDVLLTSYCDWTEYTLYLLAAERAALVERDHLWADEPCARVHLHADPALSIWGGGAPRARRCRAGCFGADDPGLFAVVQSSSGLTATDVVDAVAAHLPVRRTHGWRRRPPDAGPGRSWRSASASLRG